MGLLVDFVALNAQIEAWEAQLRLNINDPEHAIPVDDVAYQEAVEERTSLRTQFVNQFLDIYYDPSLVQAGEPILTALWRLVGGTGNYQRTACGPILDTLGEYDVYFTPDSHLIFLQGCSVDLAVEAVSYDPSETAPAWDVEARPNGQKIYRKPA